MAQTQAGLEILRSKKKIGLRRVAAGSWPMTLDTVFSDDTGSFFAVYERNKKITADLNVTSVTGRW